MQKNNCEFLLLSAVEHLNFSFQNRLGEMTWFQGANGEMVDYLGTSESGHCSCTLDQSCPDRKCRCDSGRKKIRKIFFLQKCFFTFKDECSVILQHKCDICSSSFFCQVLLHFNQFLQLC